MAIRLSGLASGLDTDTMVKELMKAQRMKSTKIEKNITKMEWKKDKWKDINSKIYSLYTSSLSKIKMQGNFNAKKASSTNEEKVTVTANTSAPEGNHIIKVKSTASAQFVTGNVIPKDIAVSVNTRLTELDLSAVEGSTITIKAGTNDEVVFNVEETTSIGDFTKALQDAGLNANYDTTQKRFFISSKESGFKNSFTITSSATVDLTRLGLIEIKPSITDGVVKEPADSTVSLVKPSDAVIIYNGAELKSPSNTISANGLTITVKDKTTGSDTDIDTDDEVINISVTKDNQTIYDMIKDFVKSYNDVLKIMNESYSADSSKGYEPLTSDEKEAMTEEEIKKWEDKIKSSLLRRDNTLSSITSLMRTTLNKSVSVDGKSYSLSSFGIVSVNYTEKGLLHINGDSEDILVSSEPDELMKALTENPDAVMEVFTKLASELYGTLSDKMKSTSLSSALTIYNDKEISKTITNYKDDLSKLELRLQDMENRYYKQFTAMETMISKLNTQSSSMASLFGMNTSTQ
jgi:flagellar hook-associated protein 2